MKTKLAALAAAVVLATLASAQTGTGRAGDEAAIRKMGEQYAAAWNSGDARQAAALFAEDGTFTDVNGQTYKGRMAIEKDLAESEVGTAKTGMTMSITTEAVRFLQPDLAVAMGRTHFSGAQGGPGGGHYMSVVRRVGSEWKVAAVHAAASPPASMAGGPGTAGGPRPTGTSGSSMAEADALVALEREWGEAVVAKNLSTLDRIMADDFTEVDPAGQTRGKQASMDEVRGGELVFESYTPNDVTSRVYGDTAIVTGMSVIKATYRGEDISGNYRWTDTFVKRDGRWQAVASQATRVVEEKK